MARELNVRSIPIDLQVGYGQWPWVPQRYPPTNLTVSTESIVNTQGQLPQCQVTVTVSETWVASKPGLVNAVVILLYQNWCASLSTHSVSMNSHKLLVRT